MAATYSPVGFVVVANDSLWTVGLPVARDATSPGMTSNNSAQWLYPAVWTQVTGVNVSSEWDRVVTDSTYPGSIVGVVHGGPGVGSVDLVSCSGSVCKVTSSVSADVSLGAVASVGLVWSSGSEGGSGKAGGSPELWIGCEAGLVYMSSSGSFSVLLDSRSADVDTGINAVAVNPSGPSVAVGNGYHLW